MGLFTWFGAPPDDVEGSYCDTASGADVELYEGDDIEDQMQNAHDRDDDLEYGDEDFEDSAISQRYDDDGYQIEQGPKEYGPQKRWFRL